MKKYEYVAEQIKNDINKNVYTSKLPSEIDLAEMYQVSRDTIRSALRQLKNKDIIYSRRGAGYYIHSIESHIPNLLNTHSTITEMIQQANYSAGKLNEHMYQIHTSEYNTYFEDMKDFFVIERTRTAEDELVGFSRIIIPVVYVGENFPIEYRSGPLKNFLADHCSIITTSAVTLIEAYRQDIDKVPVDFQDLPLIKLTQDNKFQTGKTALITVDFIRTDIIKVYVKREVSHEV